MMNFSCSRRSYAIAFILALTLLVTMALIIGLSGIGPNILELGSKRNRPDSASSNGGDYNSFFNSSNFSSSAPSSQQSVMPSISSGINFHSIIPTKIPSVHSSKAPVLTPSTSIKPNAKSSGRSQTPFLTTSPQSTTHLSRFPAQTIYSSPRRYDDHSSLSSLHPTIEPSRSPSSLHTIHTTSSRNVISSLEPSAKSSKPSQSPSMLRFLQPTSQFTIHPSRFPSSAQIVYPTPSPTGYYTFFSSSLPTVIPSIAITLEPSRSPSSSPSIYPTRSPTVIPSLELSAKSSKPSKMPSFLPSLPSTSRIITHPSRFPTPAQTAYPTPLPTGQHSSLPSSLPTLKPRIPIALKPSRTPSSLPTIYPTRSPTVMPSLEPSAKSSKPSKMPSSSPSLPSTSRFTIHPSRFPTPAQTVYPTRLPTGQHSSLPSSLPTLTPSIAITLEPSRSPSSSPTIYPTRSRTIIPSLEPSIKSSKSSQTSTLSPSLFPESLPTSTLSGSQMPTRITSQEPSADRGNNNRIHQLKTQLVGKVISGNGAMFDVVAKESSIVLTSMSVRFGVAWNWINVHVWTKDGGYEGYDDNGGAGWEKQNEGKPFVIQYPLPQGELTPITTIDGFNPIVIPEGRSVGVYVTLPGNGMIMSEFPPTDDGDSNDNGGDDDVRIVVDEDSNVRVIHGIEKRYAFGATVGRRIWGGALNYTVLPGGTLRTHREEDEKSRVSTSGAMFDVVTKGRGVTITSMAVQLDASWNWFRLELWRRDEGTYRDDAKNDDGRWVLQNTFVIQRAESSGNLTRIPKEGFEPISMAANQTVGLYVTLRSKSGMVLSKSTADRIDEDDYVRVEHGAAKGYPFGWTQPLRTWSGLLTYFVHDET